MSMRELQLAMKFFDAAYAAGFKGDVLNEIAENPERLKQFLDLHREDAKLEYVERTVDCISAPLTLYRAEREPDLKVLRHDNLGVIPWNSLRLRLHRPDRDMPRDQLDLDETHLIPKYLIDKKVAPANISEYLRRYPHLFHRDVSDRYMRDVVICWGTVYEGKDGARWAEGFRADDMSRYNVRVSDLQSYDQYVLLIEN